ncbi:Molecular chaperone (DnaJ superfamily) [Ceraceosorus bombacis]|uniref:Molecular chaperone (DnaJ superfamily) n=1 Tax=Ceraceosorus bombacis TaxID=401625 RepID=A0A0P1BLC7_9BASI|nr:Molecular chaperone (DnaJ superfamily) [Ceraceosorus bombacis]
MTGQSVPDYYTLLGVKPSSSKEEIKSSYKRRSLSTHPDRFPHASASERSAYTARFQSLADAYYVLSDDARRAEYDTLRKEYGTSNDGGVGMDSQDVPGGMHWSDDPFEGQQSSKNFFESFKGFAGFGAGAGAANDQAGPSSAGSSTTNAGQGQPEADQVFGSVFEELLRPEVERVAPIWKWVGSASGAGLGFIVGNIPGLVAGAFVGNRLGAIRDAKGRSVGQVFMTLNTSQRAEVLKALAVRVLGSI